jgi:hypothetical protein
MSAPTPSTIVLLALLPLVAWRIYMRFRRMIGRQRLSRVRPWITLAIFSTVLVLLAYAARAHAERLGWLAAGLAAGGLLAAYGLRLTRFEPTPQGLFYTPNAYLGIALSLLFFGRLVYRVTEVYAISTAASPTPSSFASSPLTLATFGLIAGYYVTYAAGLMLWRNRELRVQPQAEPLAMDS